MPTYMNHCCIMHAIEKEKHIKLNLNVLSILDSQKAAVSLISETNCSLRGIKNGLALFFVWVFCFSSLRDLRMNSSLSRTTWHQICFNGEIKDIVRSTSSLHFLTRKTGGGLSKWPPSCTFCLYWSIHICQIQALKSSVVFRSLICFCLV